MGLCMNFTFKKNTCLLAFFSLLSAVSTVFAATTEYNLKNGLKLIVQEDNRAPVAVVQIWYKVGGSYEYDGITGVSHFLEHMMFKRTLNLSSGEFSQKVSERGGRENAFTGADYTAYYQQWSVENVGLSFELEAERMQNLVIEEGEFLKEKKVVLEERRLRTDDNPRSLTTEALRAVAYQTGPYRQPIVGWEMDIKNMQVSDLVNWYENWYGPENATVVVVGDVDPENVFELAKKYFAHVPRKGISPPKRRPEVPQLGTRRLEIKSAKAKVPLLQLAFKTPVLTGVDNLEVFDWEIYALEVLAQALDGDRSARLIKNLVRGQELAARVGVSYFPVSLYTTLFNVTLEPRSNVSLETLEKAAFTEIENIQKSLLEPEELERIKTQVVADSVFQQDSNEYQATLIGSLESVGLSWEVKDRFVEEIRKVSAEQVREVALKYLQPKSLTVAFLLPDAG